MKNKEIKDEEYSTIIFLSDDDNIDPEQYEEDQEKEDE